MTFRDELTEVFITRRVNDGKAYLEEKFSGYSAEYIKANDYDLSKNKVTKETFETSDGKHKIKIEYVVDKKAKKIYYDVP